MEESIYLFLLAEMSHQNIKERILKALTAKKKFLKNILNYRGSST